MLLFFAAFHNIAVYILEKLEHGYFLVAVDVAFAAQTFQKCLREITGTENRAFL